MPGVNLGTAKALNKFKGAFAGENLLLQSIKRQIEKEEAEEEDNFDVAIPVSELRGVLFNMGGNLTKEEIDAIVTMKDDRGKQIIMIPNIQFMQIVMLASLIICVFDREGNGIIAAQDLAISLSNFTDKYNYLEIYSLIVEQDKDGNGINYDEFAKLIETTT